MVAWADYKADAKSRGALALELYAAISTPAKEPQDVKASLPDHLSYQATAGTRRVIGSCRTDVG